MKKIASLLSVLPLIVVLLVYSCGNEAVKPIKFAFVTDIHISGNTGGAMEDLQHSVADMNSIEDLDFVIFGGDITEFGSDVEIAAAKSAMDKLNHKYYIVSGNHDSKWSESGCNTFAKVFGYEVFDFEYNGIRFLGSNSGPNMRMAPALVPRESMVWLDSLTSVIPKDMPVIYVNHYPLDDAMLNYAQVKNMLRRVNTQVAICGHGHNDRVMDYSDIRGVMGRSNLRAGKDGAGYNIVTIANGEITFAERVNGVTKEPWHTIPLIKESLFTEVAEEEVPTTSPLSTVWEYIDNSDIGSAPAILDGLVYISNTSGVVKALDAATGTDVWSYKTGGKIFSSPEVSDGLLVVGSSDNSIYCLDAKSGALVWRVEAAKSVLGSPTIYNGVVYIGASDNVFRAIDLKKGDIVWDYKEIKGFVEAKPLVDKDGVYIGDWANMLYSFNPKNGKLQWTWTNNKGRMYSPAAVWPVKANGKVFIATPERVSYAINARNGKELWRAAGGREAIGLSADEDRYYIKTMQDTVIAFSTKGRRGADIVWKSNTGYGYEIAPSPITVADGLLFVPTDKGNIYALSEKDGSVVWKHNYSIALINYVKPIGERQILVTSMDGKVAILRY